MTVITVPVLEETPWPTLGPQVCRWIETNLVFGPGDLEGQPARLDIEKRAFIYRAYEVYPNGTRDENGKPIGGRRRFRRVALSLQKGSAKTELAAWIAAAELSPTGPVRCVGFDGDRPIGGPVTSPYIPMVAYTEEQADDLAYSVLKFILDKSPLRSQFDIGLDRILRADGNGKLKSLAGSPDSRDGALTSFSHKDEVQRWITPRLKRAHNTMLENLTKRPIADPWELTTGTAYIPGQNSVAEDERAYAEAVIDGTVKDSRIFYFHREASDGYDLDDAEQRRAAVVEAAGPMAEWKDISGICQRYEDPKCDRPYWETVWLNRSRAASASAFDVPAWKASSIRGAKIPAGELVTLGFDGSRFRDSTGLVATRVSDGLQVVPGCWERPPNVTAWEVDKGAVSAAVAAAFEYWNVWRMYCDPYFWESEIAEWAGRFGDKRVIEFRTNQVRRMAPALRAYAQAIAQGEVPNDGDPRMVAHIGAAVKLVYPAMTDEEGAALWIIQKDRPDSPHKIDLDMAGCLSWQARNDAIASGALSLDEGVEVHIA